MADYKLSVSKRSQFLEHFMTNVILGYIFFQKRKKKVSPLTNFCRLFGSTNLISNLHSNPPWPRRHPTLNFI